MVAGDWQPHVPAATVGRPDFHGAVVGRPDVVGPLLDARDGTLVVVTAPAGYGKTTAVRLWDEVDERPFAWLRIDHLDDDPAHLLLHIATAVAGVHPLDRDVLRYLRGPGRSPLTDLVPALVRALEHCGPLVIVLDDIDALSDPTAADTLRALVDTAPQATTVALLGRRPPPLELARRRLLNTVVEIGIGELKLSGEQATAAFKAVSGSADEGAARAVHDKCEGWAAGVVLAARAFRDGADVHLLTGRHRLVADYLLEEVLAQLDSATTTFLMESAVLDTFCAAQLDVVLQRDDSARMLAAVIQSGNLFLISLDAERIWFRYHRLFADLLRARLRDSQPERLRGLATRAADLLEREGDIDGALVSALVGR